MLHRADRWACLCSFQACNPVQVSVATRGPSCQSWTPSAAVSGHANAAVGSASIAPLSPSVSLKDDQLFLLKGSDGYWECVKRR